MKIIPNFEAKFFSLNGQQFFSQFLKNIVRGQCAWKISSSIEYKENCEFERFRSVWKKIHDITSWKSQIEVNLQNSNFVKICKFFKTLKLFWGIYIEKRIQNNWIYEKNRNKIIRNNWIFF